ncbi:hypothetical protein CH298_02725 [Rhodococcoides fascians]|uniref:hypothetical protein n=1 Tax=Rhodococcoides fascians TaxID=1828 RepID=UPI000B9BF0CB|nr:hypothetical protein [Rhodococcus fascians]OZE92466.1 hypothetical protein CH303_02725 [Rhodococcus fascians]OZF23099.1 hypothetical protein CH298_02725 [Rhodococcus fascians]OZF24813.1 hypothetical protein CH297_02725 [Rhodococcus fascians]OZF72408.1 hypothetical protein CH308_02730 [Rhodococcus fascians]OZF73706.1 hypothetical protein CH307_02725 [Rhodococcus fascians]
MRHNEWRTSIKRIGSKIPADVYRVTAALIWVYSGYFIGRGVTQSARGDVLGTVIVMATLLTVGSVAHWIMSLGYRTGAKPGRDGD